jgi:hypothetical protein
MNGSCLGSGQQPCGCCAGLTSATPEIIANRPALSSISYRSGRYSTFNASMLAALSDPAFAPLAQLRTRDPGDFSIALLDAWSVVLDILTFYQERFANEAFLRTAIDQRSVIELARLAGYVPSPGVAASAVIAYTLSNAPGSPGNVLIQAGSQVQSVPGPGQTAQVFETSADLTAQAAWNALPAQTTATWQLAGEDTSAWIAGTANNISPGDALLFVQASGGQPLTTGAADFHYATAAAADTTPGSPTYGSTQIWWDGPLAPVSFQAGQGAETVTLFVFRKKAALYGQQAPSPQVLAGPYISDVPGYQKETVSGGNSVPAVTWGFTTDINPSVNQISLDASYPGLQPPAAPPAGQPSPPPQWAVFTDGASSWYLQITSTAETSPDYYTLTVKTTRLTVAVGGALPMAPGGYPGLLAESDALAAAVVEIVGNTPNITAYVQSAQLTFADLPITTWSQDPTYPRQPGMLAPVSGSAISVTGGQQISPGQPIGVSGKCLRIQVSTGTFTIAGRSGGTSVTPGQVFVTGSFPPGADSASGNLLWAVTTLSGVTGQLSAPADAFILLPSQTGDPQAGEVALVQSVVCTGDVTTLTLTSPLAAAYDATTVTVNANAVMATNGQSVQEILGSGDATNGALQFTLKQAPLTYLTAPSGNGTVSTLQVWVNNLQWQETVSLLTAGPADRVFVTSMNAAGNTVVQFGNGVQGARPPTGVANVRAVYRTGIGSGGMVSPGQLTQPLTRPQGVSSVTNPAAASGAADPATASQVRASAPLPTLTIGRVVSLEDYQNFAMGFAGIAKALASWTWFDGVRGVFLTVAGQGGGMLSPTDPVITSLAAAIQLSGDPRVPLQVASYVPVLFTFAAGVVVNQPSYAPVQVLAQVWQAVAGAFGFDQRQLGQNIAASEIIQVIQQVPGVTAVQLQGLAPSGTPAPSASPAMLCASGPQPPSGAQLLQLDPATEGAIGVWSP